MKHLMIFMGLGLVIVGFWLAVRGITYLLNSPSDLAVMAGIVLAFVGTGGTILFLSRTFYRIYKGNLK